MKETAVTHPDFRFREKEQGPKAMKAMKARQLRIAVQRRKAVS